MLNSMETLVVEAEIKISTIVEKVMDDSKITIIVVVFIRVIATMGVPLPISVPVHKIPNLGIQTIVLVLPARFVTSLGTQ
jgi:hypothetical protein